MKNLAALLALHQIDENSYESVEHTENFRMTLFGGQVLGQALLAASNTVIDRHPHSLHAYFLRAGSSLEPVRYDVEIVRDGGSISSRRVVASQAGKVIFQMAASFHATEDGFSHQDRAPDGVAPPSDDDVMQTFRDPHVKRAEDSPYPFFVVPVGENLINSLERHPPDSMFWIRTARDFDRSPAWQCAALAYASDLGLLATALLPHSASLFQSELTAASIDHSMWFHNPNFRVDDWLLVCTHSPWAGNARGFTSGSVFTRNGVLIASTAQEGLIRPRKAGA